MAPAPKPDSSKATAAAPTETATASGSQDTGADLEKIRTLWRGAIDALHSGDNAGAIKMFEQIKTFPRDVWPLGLDIRLDAAKKQLATETGVGGNG